MNIVRFLKQAIFCITTRSRFITAYLALVSVFFLQISQPFYLKKFPTYIAQCI